MNKSSMDFFHFSLQSFPLGTLLVGMKASNKKKQRIGQQRVDEDFDAIRKVRFPNTPSLFNSLWTTNVFDPSIPRKAFEENPEIPIGYLYQVEPHWEVLACQAVTQSGLSGIQLQNYIDEMAVKFWKPEHVSGKVKDFLCPQGAIIKALVREVRTQDVIAIKQEKRAL